MALTKLTSNLIEGGTGTDWVTAIQTSNFTAEAGKGYFVNTTSQVLYVNLPVGVVGMEITIQDYAGTFGTNKVVLNANGSEKIQGSALESKINTNNATAVLIYQDATKGWTSQDIRLNATEISWATPTGQSLTYSTPSPQSSQGAEAATFPTTTFTATLAGSIISGTATIAGLPSGITAAQTITGSGAGNTLTVTLTGTFPSTDYINTNLTLSGLTVSLPVDYLVVAGGGGGGGAFGGGGGGGGLRTSYGSTTGGGGSAETQPSISINTNYTLTVGSGGTAGSGSGPGTLATNGGDSVFSTITANGGGAGGNGNTAGYDGGSGGGAGTATPVTLGGNALTSPSLQGYKGGNTNDSYGSNAPSTYKSGGGGGAGQAGENVFYSSGTGYGGTGLAVNILNATNATNYSIGQTSGSDVYYSGGGGGSNGYSVAGAGGSGGLGGGGRGGEGNNQGNPTAGVATTGGGGGGGGYNIPNGANGGSGIVILRYPNSFTLSTGSGITEASGSPFTEGSDKVSVFTAGTGTISFS